MDDLQTDAPPLVAPAPLSLRPALMRWADAALDADLFAPARPVPGEPPENFLPDALADSPRGPLPEREPHWILTAPGHGLKRRLVERAAARVRAAAAARGGLRTPPQRPTPQDLLDLMNLGREPKPHTVPARASFALRLAARLLALEAACRRQLAHRPQERRTQAAGLPVVEQAR